MRKLILVSGTPGTGKTRVAKGIAEHYDYKYVHIGEHEEYVTAQIDIKIIDVEQMIKWLKTQQKRDSKTLVVDSHLSHYFPAELTRICIITRCDPSELKTRLKKREYPEEKIRINLEAEAMDLILQEALAEGHKVHEVNTTHKIASTSVKEAIEAIDTGRTSYGEVDFSNHLSTTKF
ncbi:AAA family ATPase [archaeon]|nr:AAA family ATPase [archaeon]